MPNLPDLLSKKEELNPDLRSYITNNGRLGIQTLNHPLVQSIFYTPALNALHNEQYKQKREALNVARQEGDWAKYVFLHEKPYRIEAFCKIMDDMSDSQYWELLGDIWVNSENIWQYEQVIQNLILSERPQKDYFMDEDEKEFLNNLPDQVAIYRGHQSKNRKGWSWTLSYTHAQWFADRFDVKKAGVVRSVIPKEKVIAVLTRRKEFEVIVDPKCVKASTFNLTVDDRIFPFVESSSQLIKSKFHGLPHWKKVDWNAQQLCKVETRADLQVCRAFAYMHDCMRVNDNTDDRHGERAAEYVNSLRSKLNLTEQQIDLLAAACHDHESGQTSADPTVGVCWDADRLDLMRVGIRIDPQYLSTDAAKKLIWAI